MYTYLECYVSHFSRTPEASDHVGHQLIQSEELFPQRKRLGIDPSQLKELFNEMGHVVDLAENRSYAVLKFPVVQLSSQEFQLAVHYGKRRPEFMRGVGDKAALTLECFFEPLHHFVQGGGQPLDFIVRLRNFKAMVQGRGGNVLGRLHHAGHRSKRSAGQQIHGEC